MHLSVDCSQATGAPALGATIAITAPSASTIGTVVVFNGGLGTTMAPPQPQYVSAGLRTIQVQWDTAWENTPTLGILAAACRPATLLEWAFRNPHQASRTAAFCAQGASAGSGAISYAVSHYGMGDYLDYANLVSGPPFGRIDYGCAPSTYSGPPRALCAGMPGALSPAPYAFHDGPAMGIVDPGENTATCSSANPPSADIARWAADSIVSPGAIYNYPSTPLRFYFCTSPTTNEVTGLGSFFYEQIASQKSMGCYTSCRAKTSPEIPRARRTSTARC
jgi:hypothetical protein